MLKRLGSIVEMGKFILIKFLGIYFLLRYECFCVGFLLDIDFEIIEEGGVLIGIGVEGEKVLERLCL